MTETTETIKGPAAEPRRLTRSRENRWLGGVSAGLGEYFDLNPIVYRIAFVALALAGGTGILLYVAAWLVIPDAGAGRLDRRDGDQGAPRASVARGRSRPARVRRDPRAVGGPLLAESGEPLAGGRAGRRRDRVVAGQHPFLAESRGGPVCLGTSASGTAVAAAQAAPKPRRRSLLPVATGLLIGGLGLVGLLDATGAIDADWRIVLAAAALGLGVLVAVGALTGMRVGGVVVLGLGVLAALALAFAVHVPLFSGIGNEIESSGDGCRRPLDATSTASATSTSNLQDVAFPAGSTHVKVTLGIGNLTVTVPSDVTVSVDGRASAGNVQLLGHEDNGTHVHEKVVQAGTNPARVLVLDARVGLGELKVQRG